jgi:hypothetical protein
VTFNGRQYNYLPANLVQQLANIPAAPAPVRRQRRQRSPVALQQNLPPVQNNHLHPDLAQQLANIPAAPAPVRRGRRAIPDAPVVPPVPVVAPVPVAPDFALPEARQPFSRNWEVHNLGRMDVKCPDCHALHWMSERLTKSSKRNPKFGTCCLSGKISLPQLDPPPIELRNLLFGQDTDSKHFRQNIRKYNNALAMTSLGCETDHTVNEGGGGPYVFKVHGQLSHHAGSLLPPEQGENNGPSYAQLYIYDPAEALDYRMNNQYNNGLNRQTMQILQDMLHRRHPGVRMYKQAYELT